jgi:hypothetical protein
MSRRAKETSCGDTSIPVVMFGRHPPTSVQHDDPHGPVPQSQQRQYGLWAPAEGIGAVKKGTISPTLGLTPIWTLEEEGTFVHRWSVDEDGWKSIHRDDDDTHSTL